MFANHRIITPPCVLRRAGCGVCLAVAECTVWTTVTGYAFGAMPGTVNAGGVSCAVHAGAWNVTVLAKELRVAIVTVIPSPMNIATSTVAIAVQP